MSSESRTSPHTHEAIHLPPPSWGPVVVGFGATVTGVGLVLLAYPLPWPLVFPFGLLLLLGGVWKISNFSLIEELSPSMGVNSRMLGMWVFLASEIMFFTGLIATFLGYQARAEDVARLLDVPLMTVGTFVLLSSSFGAVSALAAIRQGRVRTFRNWLIATMVMGALFLGVELLEWSALMGHGITTGTLYGSAFFTLTGFHGLHVLIGIAWMAFLLARTLLGRVSSSSAVGVEVFGLYWHFVDIVWIILFTIIYLISR